MLSDRGCKLRRLWAIAAAPLVTTAAMKGRNARRRSAAASVRTAHLGAMRRPFRLQDRPHDVVADDGTVPEAAAQHAFTSSAELLEKAVATRIDVDRARL